MSGFDGAGNYTRAMNWVNDKTNGINITASRMDTEDNTIATAFNNVVTRDGQGKPTADFLPGVDNTYKLGSASFRWTSINGVLNFNSSNAISINAPTAGIAITVSGLSNARTLKLIGGSTSGQSYGLQILAGTNASDLPLEVQTQSGASDLFYVQGNGETFITSPPAATAGVSGCFQVGYLDAPQNLQNTASYTIALTDRGKSIAKSGGVAGTWTIPANASVAFPIGTTILLAVFPGANNVTLAITTDTLYWATGSGSLTTGSRTLNGSGGSLVTLYKVGATQWMVSGTGIS